jgi:hypothetical protein
MRMTAAGSQGLAATRRSRRARPRIAHHSSFQTSEESEFAEEKVSNFARTHSRLYSSRPSLLIEHNSVDWRVTPRLSGTHNLAQRRRSALTTVQRWSIQ